MKYLDFGLFLSMSKSITLVCKRDTLKSTANLNYQFKKRLENKVLLGRETPLP